MSLGGWIPDRPDRLAHWIDKILEEVKKRKEIKNPAVIEFKNAIESDPALFMGFHRMFDSVPNEDPLGRPQVKDHLTMLYCFDKFVGEALTYDPNSLVFLPFTAIMQWPMYMSNGFTILVNRTVNDQFRSVFGEWSKYLSSADSASVLTEDAKGWLGERAMQNMPDFIDLFVCDPEKPHWGFTSWDHFFARTLRHGARPIDYPDDDTYITSACESNVLRYSVNVKSKDMFWLKDAQPYSLVHMLADPLANSFVGGTVYQAFLSPYYYHRWHAPVAGTIVKTCVVEGTYFAGIPQDTLPTHDFDAFQGQQPFLTHVATRALIFILADDPRIGLMCFLGVGMVEVSSCEILVRAGEHVAKGQEIGTFHFGGSTHALVFGSQVKLEFLKQQGDSANVRSAIARLSF
ncbi:phosphatidylserine decarboxylase-like protein [Mycena metata]|uniref:Phosphatidylserine decarboxylase-like protein n=1 Tax=Mycena metata TaxID=1033252 RepID=A0AAD7GZN6_9AGAR|nr:phosphatidylserine decarboxylase-like protein [Mycena metata]